jgi:hypothetical protein
MKGSANNFVSHGASARAKSYAVDRATGFTFFQSSAHLLIRSHSLGETLPYARTIVANRSCKDFRPLNHSYFQGNANIRVNPAKSGYKKNSSGMEREALLRQIAIISRRAMLRPDFFTHCDSPLENTSEKQSKSQ